MERLPKTQLNDFKRFLKALGVRTRPGRGHHCKLQVDVGGYWANLYWIEDRPNWYYPVRRLCSLVRAYNNSPSLAGSMANRREGLATQAVDA